MDAYESNFDKSEKSFLFKRQKIIDVLGIVSGSFFSLCRVKCFEQHQPNIK